MKVLFISSGNTDLGIKPIVFNQGESLKNEVSDLIYYTIKGTGFRGYFRNIIKLRRYLKHNQFDVIHAHYSLTAIVASLGGCKPLIVSLMGSDVNAGKYKIYILYLFYLIFWKITIVKSEDMKRTLNFKKVMIVPNGVDFECFQPMNKIESQNRLGWDSKKLHVLFVANPNIPVKNFILAKEAFYLLDNKNIELHYLENIPYTEMIYYYNSSDVVLLTSKYEGSPNVIKEAMACNCPIVSVDVGDVKSVIENTEGCYCSSYEPEVVANRIKEALSFGKRTNGRKNIQHLDSKLVAEQIFGIYKSVL